MRLNVSTRVHTHTYGQPNNEWKGTKYLHTHTHTYGQPNNEGKGTKNTHTHIANWAMK